MKLCLIGPTWPYRGGIAHFTTLLARALDRLGHDVLLLSFARQYPAFLYPGRSDREPGEGAPRFDKVEHLIDSVNPVTWLQAAARIRGLDPDGLITQWWAAFWTPHHLSIALLLRSPRRPTLATICHNATEHEPSRSKVVATRLVLGLSDLVMTHSESGRRELSRMLPRAQVVRERHPTYAPMALPREDRARTVARRRLGIPGEEPLLLFFGFVRRYKGLDILLEAMALNLDTLPTRLFVAGEFWEDRAPYEMQIDRLGLREVVTIRDRYVPVSELAEHFAAANLAVFPYRTSSQSGAAQLAAGFGCRYIASDAGGLGEGARGHLFRTNDPDALAKKIATTLADGETALPPAGPTWEHYAALLAGRIEELRP